jgi:hypothetical protein
VVVVMESTISVSVHPKAGDGLELRGFESDQGVAGFVAVRVPPGVSLWFYTVADLDALIAAAVEARTWLAADQAGQSPLPLNRPANPYLTVTARAGVA